MSLAQTGAVVSVIGAVVGGWVFLDDRHAHHDDVKELAGYVSTQFLELRYDTYRTRLWELEKKTGCRGPVEDECRWLRREIERIKRELVRNQRK